eukprot:2174372-Rhodomonas_salina.1
MAYFWRCSASCSARYSADRWYACAQAHRVTSGVILRVGCTRSACAKRERRREEEEGRRRDTPAAVRSWRVAAQTTPSATCSDDAARPWLSARLAASPVVGLPAAQLAFRTPQTGRRLDEVAVPSPPPHGAPEPWPAAELAGQQDGAPL